MVGETDVEGRRIVAGGANCDDFEELVEVVVEIKFDPSFVGEISR